MKKIDKKFKNEKLGLVLDIYEDNSKEWFKAQDIAEFLEYRDTHTMTRYLNEPEMHSYTLNWCTAQGNQYQAMFIDEYALYEVMLRVTKADETRYNKAREFQRWVFGEVLPSIRKDGGYIMADTKEEAYKNAIASYKATLKRIEEQQKVARDFADARSKTIDNLNDIIGDLEYKYNETLLAADELRFIIAKMFGKRNNTVIDIEHMTPGKQQEIFDLISVEYPELRDIWDKIIRVARGEVI